MEKCVIVIPVHRPEPSAYECISLEQCFKILGRYPAFLVAPVGMNVDAYLKIYPALQVKWVSPKWTDSLLNYNKLKMSKWFYKLFDAYEYMLTYELDAFIFEDRLNHWCSQAYDFIGAPWFDGWAIPGEHLSGVGNSGFSLRNIKALKKGIRAVYYFDPQQPTAYSSNRYIRYFNKRVQLLKNKFIAENPTLQNALLLNEDWIIGELMAKKIKGFKLAPISDAINFSFEVKPEVLLEINNGQLPMGCHAWWKYNLPFWKPYIENFGYQL